MGSAKQQQTRQLNQERNICGIPTPSVVKSEGGCLFSLGNGRSGRSRTVRGRLEQIRSFCMTLEQGSLDVNGNSSS